MKKALEEVSLPQLKRLYDDIELALVFDWLGVERPKALRRIDVEAETGDFDEESEGSVRPMRSVHGDYGELALRNAVARLVLSEIQDRLPQWAHYNGDGEVTLGRKDFRHRPRKGGKRPRFLFEINWADSGPGFCWPEAYHVADLPGFGVLVVTASQDSPDVHGYTDEAIGSFCQDEPVLEDCRKVITGWWWRRQLNEWEQHRWAELLRTGKVRSEVAEAWAHEVWGGRP